VVHASTVGSAVCCNLRLRASDSLRRGDCVDSAAMHGRWELCQASGGLQQLPTQVQKGHWCCLGGVVYRLAPLWPLHSAQLGSGWVWAVSYTLQEYVAVCWPLP